MTEEEIKKWKKFLEDWEKMSEEWERVFIKKETKMDNLEFLDTFPEEVKIELKNAVSGKEIAEIAEKYGYKIPIIMNAYTIIKNQK